MKLSAIYDVIKCTAGFLSSNAEATNIKGFKQKPFSVCTHLTPRLLLTPSSSPTIHLFSSSLHSPSFSPSSLLSPPLHHSRNSFTSSHVLLRTLLFRLCYPLVYLFTYLFVCLFVCFLYLLCCPFILFSHFIFKIYFIYLRVHAKRINDGNVRRKKSRRRRKRLHSK